MDYSLSSALYWKSTNFLNLIETYERHVREGSARGRDGVHPLTLQGDIVATCHKLSAKLRSGDYRFTQYRELLKSKGAGKPPRVISVPTSRDRIALRALTEFLGELYPHARGAISQVRIQEVCAELFKPTNFNAFIKIDVENFFPSIKHDRIRSALSQSIDDVKIIEVIMRAVETPTVPDGSRRRGPNLIGTPQGLAVSNMIAELVSHPVDEALRSNDHCAYFRFVDDVLVLCNSAESDSLFQYIKNQFNIQGLKIHGPDRQGKTYTGKISDGFEYLGYLFSEQKVSVRAASVRNIEASIARTLTKYKNSKRESDDLAAKLAACEFFLNLKITGCLYKGAPRGWVQYFRQMDDLTLLKKLDSTVNRFISRFGLKSQVRQKNFMRTYWALRHPYGRDADYIPNFDTWSHEMKRSLLFDISGNSQIYSQSDENIDRGFAKLLDSAVSELERDLSPTY